MERDTGTGAGNPGFSGRLEAVWRRIHHEELISLARDLARIPSVHPTGDPEGNEERAARYVAEYLERAGFEVSAEEVAPGRPNVWAVWSGNRPGKTLLFESHTDDVTEGHAEERGHSLFEAGMAGPRIYGRGACDTKGNLAAVVAVRTIKDSGVPFAGRLVLCHPVDEEGMMCGIKRFIRGGRAEGVDGAVICEPEENQLRVAQKGAMRVEIQLRGRMAHGTMPGSGVNPVTRAARLVVAIEELERDEIERHGKDPLIGYPSITPTATARDDPLVRAMAAHQHLTGEPPRYNGMPGATDGTFLHAWAGVPIITTGAGGRTDPHHKDEWVDADELLTTCKLYAATAMYFCEEEARV